MKLRFIFSEVGKGLVRNRAVSVAVVLVTFVSLLFVGIAGLSQLQVSRLKSEWVDKIEVSVYMCGAGDETICQSTEATEDQIDAVRSKLASPELAPYVKEVFEESKEDAYNNVQKQFGDSAIARWVTPDLMQYSFRVKLVNPDSYSEIQDAIKPIKETIAPMEGVAVVRDQREVVEPLFQLLERAKMISLGLAGVMTVAAILLITTTIRLSALSRERETSIMRLVGASALFIQAPFMIEGALAAIVGALMSVATLFVGVHFVVQGWLADSFKWVSFIGLREVWLMAPVLIIAAVLLAVIASAFSLAKYTKV